MTVCNYAELDCISNFSFLRGASHPEELAAQAAFLKLFALGLADDNTLAGVVRAHLATKLHQVKLLVGSRLIFADHTLPIIIYPVNLSGYQSLSRLLSIGKMRAKKGKCVIYYDDLCEVKRNCIAIGLPDNLKDEANLKQLLSMQTHFGDDNFFVAANFLYDGFGDEYIASLRKIERRYHLSIVVTNSVIAHDKSRRALADVISCIKMHTTLDAAGKIIKKNGERYLKSPEEMWRLFNDCAPWLKNSVRIAERVSFTLRELVYQYPSFTSDGEITDQDLLAKNTFIGAKIRYGTSVPEKVRKLLKEELILVGELGYATYFLTIHDIVMFAKSKAILCQGRGSAANSAICYCLGITEVDPNTYDLLFGRFLSKERNEVPDIDVDFENARREEVIQYIYQKYGRTHAALTATVITYRKRMAVREVAKAFGLPQDAIDALMQSLAGISLNDIINDEKGLMSIAEDAGLSNKSMLLVQVLSMAKLLLRFPRHLGQHVGGFVINQNPLNELVPIGNAAMDDRSFIEWDKDDLNALGILKVDILALGMLSAIRRCFSLIEQHYGKILSLSIRREDKNVYDMLKKADTIGVFQVESRAQMSMLPRLKPEVFYDLVIEVAIVRPGPIQGEMVHPYLRRRQGLEKVTYPSAALKKVLEKTLGIPLFQEQVMQVAMVGAGFTAGEADSLRRSMATFKRLGKVNNFHQRFIDGMLKNGYTLDFAERVFNQILGFAEYGFPESHAASFANLVYVSAWLKYYYPAAFACALLNSQPMGFYASAQIIADAVRHGVKILPIDINSSGLENTLEKIGTKEFAIRLGFSEIKGLNSEQAEWIIACRPVRGFTSIADIRHKSSISKATLMRMNKARAFFSLVQDQRKAEWEILGLPDDPPPLLAHLMNHETENIVFPKLSQFECMELDYHYTGVSLENHPMSFIRPRLTKRGYISSQDINGIKDQALIKVAGLIIIRQRPQTAGGVIFFTLEDELGLMNIVIWPKLAKIHRKVVLLSRAVAIVGRLEKKNGVHHIIAENLSDISDIFHNIKIAMRNFH